MSERRGLGPGAFEPPRPGAAYEPYVPASASLQEFTLKAIGLGILFGIIFGAANAYLGLRAGLTISTSIPVAVMTVAVFRALEAAGHRGTILEANLSQTVGSASSSLASGIIFTLPALFLWGLSPTLLQMTMLAMCGGVLGILFMVPLRRFLIEREHGKLPYPEGTACAEVLVANEVGGGNARFVFIGLAAGAGFKALTSWARAIPDSIHVGLPWRKAEVGMDLSPALFGVGFILGPRIAAVMVGGGLLSWLVIIPMLDWWGAGLDLPLKVVGIGVLLVIATLAFVPIPFGEVGGLTHRLVAAVCVAVFAFFFVTVASRIVGLVGVTSNPTSGMTIAALLGTAGIFLAMGWTDITGKAAAITVGCVVAIAASISGDTSQDLKTGYLLGATPRRQQVGELVGVLTSAVFVCLAVLLLAETFGFGSTELPAPQATLMKLVIDGVLDQSLPWGLVALGIAIAVACELLKIPSLPFAVGVYLPVSTMTPIFLGGLLRWWAERSSTSTDESNDRRERGILLGSGFVGGEGLLGVGIAGAAFVLGRRPLGIGTGWLGTDAVAMVVGLVAFAAFAAWFFLTVRHRAR